MAAFFQSPQTLKAFIMSKRSSIQFQVYLIISVLIVLTTISGIITIWYSYRMESLFSSIVNRNFAAYQAAESLETAMINQKGFVSYYFMDGDTEWLRQLGEFRQMFRQKLERAKGLTEDAAQLQALENIEKKYKKYIIVKDEVLRKYETGERESVQKEHYIARDLFFEILNQCSNYKKSQIEKIYQAKTENHEKAIRLRILSVSGICFGFGTGIVLLFVFMNQIVKPLKKLVDETYTSRDYSSTGNEVKALTNSVHGLIRDAGETRGELERSRATLLQAEKMVQVGKLAAGMAHSIRNPLTSVKMRLFSLSRSLDLISTQQEDFEVISEEIRHIDTIVQNFLEFSRPPKLEMQTLSPSTVVDNALRLLSHRLKSYDVTADVKRNGNLPLIEGDPEQLKEVIVNLIENACEAMMKNGKIDITEESIIHDSQTPMAVISITDNGPGMSADVLDRIMQPFFTTKEEGTGLGLSIAARIIEKHRGWLEVTSEAGEGTTFSIILPAKKDSPRDETD